MLIVLQRVPRADAPYWPGRRLLAVLDAVLWPAAWIATVAVAPARTGMLGAVVVAVALVCAPMRIRRAVFANEHYRFATWRWGKPVALLFVLGALLKLAPLIAA